MRHWQRDAITMRRYAMRGCDFHLNRLTPRRADFLRCAVILFALFMPLCKANDVAEDTDNAVKANWAIAVHGGAGAITPKLSAEKEAVYHAALERALATGRAILAEGGSAVDAVEETVRVLENEPLFNAGRGAVMTIEGTFELDASIMDGSNLKTGGVAGIKVASNPISVARAVMDQTDHVLMAGAAADAFAVANGFGTVSQEYFFTQSRFDALQKRRQKLGLPPLEHPAKRHSEGTVGAVARDEAGNLAAATSTGGRVGKLVGRIGDSPIAGAGNYAANGVAAISGTGIGEEFIRHSAAAQVAWFVKHSGLPLQAATDKVLNEVLKVGDGGMIAIGPDGPPVLRFTTESMTRGFADSTGTLRTMIWPDDRREPADNATPSASSSSD
jgi:L-asparaginase / beta-aspartyl-peptidase